MKKAALSFSTIILSIIIIPLCFAGVFDSAPFKEGEQLFTVFDTGEKQIISLTPSEFLAGALFAQTDPEYEPEALKAQAIVSYTNALFAKEHRTENSDYDFEINISEGYLYLDPDAAKAKYQDRYSQYLSYIESAVNSVLGKRITIDSKTVLAPYFKASAGYTEDAGVVWGQEAEYLKPVECNGDLLYTDSKHTSSFSVEHIRSLVKERYKIDLPDESAVFFAVNGRTSSGTVISCNIGSLTMTGQDFRSLLGLRSANFDITCDGKNVTVICYGDGHCVGMSQNEADFLARQGKNYSAILKHFYTGIEITD